MADLPVTRTSMKTAGEEFRASRGKIVPGGRERRSTS
jgi:hypothetical protein